MICETCAKELVLALAAAILGVALPLLIGAIQRIDDKYRSTRLVGLFAKEWATKCFLFFLIATIIELFAYIVILPQDWEEKLADTIWYDAWGYMAAICCIGMVVGLLWIVYLIRIYYDAPRLQKRLFKEKVDAQSEINLEKEKLGSRQSELHRSFQQRIAFKKGIGMRLILKFHFCLSLPMPTNRLIGIA